MNRSRADAARRALGGRTGALVLGTVLALAACAGPATPGSSGSPTRGFAGFPSCADVPTLTADPALYRDEPRYGNGTELVEQVNRWASSMPGFVELWLDGDRHGWVSVGFHGADVAALQEEAARKFPGEGVVVVALPHTLADLQSLQERVVPALTEVGATPAGVGLDVTRGVMSIVGVPASPAAEEALRQFSGEPLCVDTVDASELVPEGEQPTAGEGWRLLGHAPGVGEAYRTAVATTDDQLATLWASSALPGAAPAVDWQAEIVVWFGAVHGSSCPVRLDGVIVDGATLHGDIVVPGSGPETACTADANPHSFVVALDRALLPTGPFVVQLDADAPPPGAPKERTMVDADLSAPGSQATDAPR